MSGPDVATVAEMFAGLYDIVEPMPWNGLALTYKAKKAGAGGEPVVLALLPIDCEGAPAAAALFEVRAKALVGLEHPRLLTVAGQGVRYGVPFLELSYVEGETLDHLVAAGPLSRDRACTIARRVLRALELLEAVNILHLDLTPPNILVIGEDDVRVMGSGVAALLREVRDDDKTGPTGKGSGKSPGRFLAPELLVGDKIDARSDLFSVGALLHFMLTAHPLGKGGPPPPKDLRAIVVKATAKSRDARYARAAAMRAAIEATGAPLTLMPPALDEAVAAAEAEATAPVLPKASNTPLIAVPSTRAVARTSSPVAATRPVTSPASSMLDSLNNGHDSDDDDELAAPARLPAPPMIPFDAASIGGVSGDRLSDVARVGARDLLAPVAHDARPRVEPLDPLEPPAPGFLTPAAPVVAAAKAPQSMSRALIVTVAAVAHAAAVIATVVFVLPAREGEGTVRAESAADPTRSAEPAAATRRAPREDDNPNEAPLARANANVADETAATADPADPVDPDGPSAPPNRAEAPELDLLAGDLPEPLAAAWALVTAGDELPQRERHLVVRYASEHHDDARPHLLIARDYMARGWSSDAIQEYQDAFASDPECRADVRMRDDLMELSTRDGSGPPAARAVAHIYGRDALPDVEAMLDGDLEPNPRRHLDQLRRRLDTL